MKTLKITFVALITLLTVSAANAQVRVRATIGTQTHRTVVVRHRGYYRRPVVVRHEYAHRPYHRGPITVIRRPGYHRTVVVRHR